MLGGSEPGKATADLFRKIVGAKSPEAQAFYAKLRAIQESSGPHLITYPRALFQRTRAEDYREAHRMALRLAAGSPPGLASRLPLWTEYLLRFKELFDRYQAGAAVPQDVEDFRLWCGPLLAERVVAIDRLDGLLDSWIRCLETGKEWLHFNLDWEDDYIRKHDFLLNETLAESPDHPRK